MTLHFFGLNYKSHNDSHSSSDDKPFLIDTLSLASAISFKSSANNLVTFLTLSGKSLTQRTKSKGPKTEPCGTPERTSLNEE